MNRHFYIIIAMIISLSACDSALEIEPDGQITAEVLNTAEGLESALVGAYYNLGGTVGGFDGGELLGGDFILIPTLLGHVSGSEIIWDRLNGFNYNDFMDKEILLTNTRVEANWRRAYETLNLVNTILANIDNIEDGTDRNRIEGEALAIRGVLYFEMVRLWAPQFGTGNDSSPAIPLILTPFVEIADIQTPTLATVQAVYDQAEADLMAARDLLNPFGTNGTGLSVGACEAYLARLHLQKGDYAEAESFASSVINSGNYALSTDVISAFNNSTNSTEDIYAVQQTVASNSGDRSTGTGLPFYHSSLTESGLGIFRVTEFFLFFNPEGPGYPLADDRGSVDLDVDGGTTSPEINTAFYLNIGNNLVLSPAKYNASTNVIPIVRLAEMILTRAEANFEQNPSVIGISALNDLNTIRLRAGLAPLLSSDFASPGEFRDALRLERRRELLFEGQHLHDLRRWDGSVGSIDARDSRLLLPIPQAETDTGTGG